jgi:hypothetical protein
MFPANDGVSAMQSPRRIMTGQVGEYGVHCRLEFGEYVQTNESHDNTMATRTTGAIAMCPTGNIQAGYYLMSLTTAKRSNRNTWTRLPMPGESIERVHTLSRRNQAGAELQFSWRNGAPLDDGPEDEDDLHDADFVPDDDATGDKASDSNNDGSYAPNPPPAAGVDNDPYNEADPYYSKNSENHSDNESSTNDDGDDGDDGGEDGDDDGDNGGANISDNGNDDDNVVHLEANDVQVPDGGIADERDSEGVASSSDSEDSEGTDSEATGVAQAGVDQGTDSEATGVAQTTDSTGSIVDDVQTAMDRKYGTRSRSGLRPWKNPRSPCKIKEPESPVHNALTGVLANELCGFDGFTELEHVALTQYNMKQGLELFGEAAVDAVVKEMKQLHDRKTI